MYGFLDDIKAQYVTNKNTPVWFLEEHIKVVEVYAHKLCDLFLHADREAVICAVWFHDIGRLEGIDEGHDVYGGNEAQRLLEGAGISSKIIEKVVDACLGHRCKEVKPKTLEGKILSSADAMSHFHGTLPLRIFASKISQGISFEDTLSKLRLKLERDFNEKIQFEEAREMVRERYEAWRKILS